MSTPPIHDVVTIHADMLPTEPGDVRYYSIDRYYVAIEHQGSPVHGLHGDHELAAVPDDPNIEDADVIELADAPYVTVRVNSTTGKLHAAELRPMRDGRTIRNRYPLCDRQRNDTLYVTQRLDTTPLNEVECKRCRRRLHTAGVL